MATDQELIDYYADLLILQYKEKLKAYGTIQATALPFIMNQLPIAVQNAFDVDTSVGKQLNILGKYSGVTRIGYNSQGEQITLDDTDFRTIIKFAIITNSAGSSLYDIQLLLTQFFPEQVLVYDDALMHLVYYISTTAGSLALINILVSQGLLPKPMGVRITAIIYAPSILNFFGFSTYLYENVTASPFNTYDDYDMDSPWLSYKNAFPT